MVSGARPWADRTHRRGQAGRDRLRSNSCGNRLVRQRPPRACLAMGHRGRDLSRPRRLTRHDDQNDPRPRPGSRRGTTASSRARRSSVQAVPDDRPARHRCGRRRSAHPPRPSRKTCRLQGRYRAIVASPSRLLRAQGIGHWRCCKGTWSRPARPAIRLSRGPSGVTVLWLPTGPQIWFQPIGRIAGWGREAANGHFQ
jgi:hypothetical protein